MVFVTMGTLKPEALIPTQWRNRSILPPSMKKTWKLQEFQRQRKTSLEDDCFQMSKLAWNALSSAGVFIQKVNFLVKSTQCFLFTLHFSYHFPQFNFGHCLKNVLAFHLELHNSIWALCCSIILIWWFNLTFSLGSAFWALFLSGSSSYLHFE